MSIWTVKFRSKWRVVEASAPSAPVVVAAPVFSVVPTITGTPTEGQTLTATTGTASGSPTYALQWRRNGAVISGATNTTYVLQVADVGTSITVTSTATNAGGSVSATSAATATVAAASGGVLDPSISAPVLSLFTANLTYPPQLDVELDDTAVVGDTIRLQWDNNADFSSITGDATNVIDAGEASANAATFTGLSSITTGTHRFRARVERGASYSAWSNVITQGPDDLAPVLSLPTATDISGTGATLGVTTDTAEGTLYVVVVTTNSQPSNAQIKAGQNSSGAAAVYAASQAITSAGAKTFGATGLTADTGYYRFHLHRDAAGNEGVFAGGLFTTAAGGTSVAQLTTGSGLTGAGPNRNRYVDVPDGFLFTGNADIGAPALVRSTTPMPDEVHMEVRANQVTGGAIWFGVADSSQDFSSDYDKPGDGSQQGFVIQIGTNGLTLWANGTAPAFEIGGVNDATAIAAGLIFGIDYKHSTRTLTVKRKVGAAAETTVINAYVLTTNIPTTPTACAAAANTGNSGTANFGATAFAIASSYPGF